ncbi:arylsulfatase [Pedobacter yulinensis]|uniref:Arylsulfatase n=1 Tax=Pedobacter yulinensis TaxID=2126353 RepID=A0A2T3HJ94_9SPHI|nr:arylsulfatase [Pedobacter yulinensis]PST82507.1 arylsulfatase [Pedobacter yulinensis]
MRTSFFFLLSFLAAAFPGRAQQNDRPNVIYIYADDLGFGDLGCYGTSKLATPNLDKLAAGGIRFTNAHATSGTCTPSRFALMTGQYPWRQQGTGILPGDASLIIPTDRISLPKVFKNAGYATAIVGKWHLGLGNNVDKNWNATVKPGPNEVGFDYSFIFPATADRVPTVFMENGDVLARDAADPIAVNYTEKIGNDPTGLENPELLKMKASPNHGHNNTIVNGIGRIGWMTGGHRARWVDEEVSATFLVKANEFMEQHANKPFFLYFPLTEPHVPRMPATQFKGKSGLGYRGDAILQLDWTVGQVMKQLEALGIARNTIIIFSSDNGPVLDDGYEDEAVTKLGDHKPLGPLRGGKYSALEGGTRVPFILNWPARVKPAVSEALVCQMDLLASFSALLNQKVPAGQATDSENHADAFLGKATTGRKVLVKQGTKQPTAIIAGDWKYIRPAEGPTVSKSVGIETGNSARPQLYNLKNDLGEKNNLAGSSPERVKELSDLLESITASGRK